MWRFLGGASSHFLDDAALVLEYAFHQLHVLLELRRVLVILAFLAAHGRVAIATHADGHHVFGAFHALDALAEESVEPFGVGGVVPLAIRFAVAGILLVVAGHWLMVGGTYAYAHLVSGLSVLGVICVECPSPHGRPQVITFQPENQLKHPGVEVVVTVVCAVSVLHPRGKAGCFIIEEDATVFYGWLAVGIAALLGVYVSSFDNRYVHPPIPGRDTHLLRKFIDAIHGSTAVTARYDQGAVNPFHRLVYGLDDVFLVFALQFFLVQLAVFE